MHPIFRDLLKDFDAMFPLKPERAREEVARDYDAHNALYPAQQIKSPQNRFSY